MEKKSEDEIAGKNQITKQTKDFLIAVFTKLS